MSDNLNEVKAKVDETVEEFKESKTCKAILGDDGKFTKEDIDRISQDVKESKAGKTVLGEDGKFDKEDIERLSGDAKAAIKNAAGKIKGMFSE